MTNKEVANILRKVAAVYTLKSENRFRIIAYDKAIESVEKTAVSLENLWKEGKLKSVSGIGDSLSSHLDELFKTGKVKYYDNLLKDYPKAMFPLLSIPGFGPKTTYKLAQIFKLNNPTTVIDDLYRLAKAGKVARIEGFGEKSEKDIIEAIERFKKGQGKSERMPLPIAGEIADLIITYLKKCPEVLEVITLGSLRRQLSNIGDIDLAVSTLKPDKVINWFIDIPEKERVIEKGPTGATITVSGGRHIDLRVTDPKNYGSMLQYFTGSKNHNIHLREFALKKGYSLNEYGIRPVKKTQISKLKSQNYNSKLNIFEFPAEKEFYNFLGLSWIPPEIREDTGEIEYAIRQFQGKSPGLPKLINQKDIKGEFHIHTNYDLNPSHDLGASPLIDILLKAHELGYEYVGISDHNPKQKDLSQEQVISIMKARKEYYEHISISTKSVRVKLFLMLEIDILPDGKLALPEKAFDYIDAAIVSVHSSFGMTKNEITDRIIKGLSHPKARILGHPTGRLIGKREGYEIDWERLFKFCKENQKALEINSYPDRLDLNDIMVREAVKENIKMVIDTDSHEVSQMDLIKYGVGVARRGWATKADIINTMEYNKIKEWLIKS